MPMLAQNIIVFALAGGCLGYIAWQARRVLAGKGGKLGSCCGKGCGGQAEEAARAAKGQTHFIPSEMLRRKK